TLDIRLVDAIEALAKALTDSLTQPGFRESNASCFPLQPWSSGSQVLSNVMSLSSFDSGRGEISYNSTTGFFNAQGVEIVASFTEQVGAAARFELSGRFSSGSLTKLFPQERRRLCASGNSEEALPPISLTPGDHRQLVLRCRAARGAGVRSVVPLQRVQEVVDELAEILGPENVREVRVWAEVDATHWLTRVVTTGTGHGQGTSKRTGRASLGQAIGQLVAGVARVSQAEVAMRPEVSLSDGELLLDWDTRVKQTSLTRGQTMGDEGYVEGLRLSPVDKRLQFHGLLPDGLHGPGRGRQLGGILAFGPVFRLGFASVVGLGGVQQLLSQTRADSVPGGFPALSTSACCCSFRSFPSDRVHVFGGVVTNGSFFSWAFPPGRAPAHPLTLLRGRWTGGVRLKAKELNLHQPDRDEGHATQFVDLGDGAASRNPGTVPLDQVGVQPAPDKVELFGRKRRLLALDNQGRLPLGHSRIAMVFKRVSTNGFVVASGLAIDLLDFLARKLNFRRCLVGSPVLCSRLVRLRSLLNKLLVYHKNCTANCIGYGLGAGPFTKTTVRDAVIDYTTDLYAEYSGVIVPRAEARTGLWNVFLPLHWTVWLALGGSVFVAAFFVWILAYFSPFSSTNLNLDGANIDEARYVQYVWTMIGSFLQQGQDFYPSAMSPRTLLAFWWFFNVIIYAVYTAFLTSTLTVSVTSVRIRTLQDLADQNEIQPAVSSGSNMYTLLTTAQTGVYKQLGEKLLAVRSCAVEQSGVGDVG
uniref:PBPe domain-containing protein n=1 Tax=Macrostomum lignano TaxID=282301 RepID=A0A1I8GU87_9PLAT